MTCTQCLGEGVVNGCTACGGAGEQLPKMRALGSGPYHAQPFGLWWIVTCSGRELCRTETKELAESIRDALTLLEAVRRGAAR